MQARRVRITDTSLRDGHQSLWATRMRTSEMLPILELMDQVGYNSLECWGGATFDASLRFLDEDPWERLRLIKRHAARTPLQMLLRGQNLVGYRHYGDDIVRRFVHKAAENGIDIFRVFDALNDIRNFETAVEAIKETGKHFQAAVVYTISPVHSLDHYLRVAHELADMGADSICIKDMAALLSPFYAEQLIGRLKAELEIPIQLHCHYIGGLAPMTYLKAIEAGVDVIDTATVPLAFGNSQPATEMVVTALIGTPYDTELDLEKLFDIAKYFESVRKDDGWDRGVTSLTHMQVYSHQVPGGMISNLESQLKEQNALDRLPEVLEEIPVVRAEVGFPPLVTPMSQIVGTQAVLNVLSGRRWHIVPDEMKQYLRGRYGAAPGPVSQEVIERVLEGEEPISCRPADLVEETLEDYRDEIGELARSEEDLLSYALFPQTARAYLEKHAVGVESDVFGMHDRWIHSQAGAELLDRSGDRVKDILEMVEESGVDEVTIEEGPLKVTVRKAGVAAAPAPEAPAAAPAPASAGTATAVAVPGGNGSQAEADGYHVVRSKWVATFYRSPAPGAPTFVNVGDRVAAGQTLCILEMMKMMNELTADIDGVVREILVDDGATVQYGQPLFNIEPA
ncbi:MAG: acetyl-CoA carboxylase biotin carboxyl carrier protein [Thermoleophilia bacterium]|jgi:oxaloacetate decarboxylase alpha subunit|nr:acetyl-CoA carboxylase biotin carboxyl carrier protein [Thermoleophilia bacterium]